MSELRNIRAAAIKASDDTRAAVAQNPALTEEQRKQIKCESFKACLAESRKP